MGLYVRGSDANGGLMHADAEKLATQIQYGDGIHWTGDPRLELGIATACAPKSMWMTELGRRVRKGEVLARRYEVHRHNEDGTMSLVGHWRLEEFDRILIDLAPLRMDAPGRTDTIDEIDKHNDALEKERSTAVVEAMAEDLEHRLKLEHDVNEGRNVFRGMPGMRDTIKPSDGPYPPNNLILPEPATV